MASPHFRHLRKMSARDPREKDRASSPLEAFFDLVFVVAVSFSSETLFRMEADGRFIDGVVNYLLVFFAIWWAWMSFTWFASAFDTDDWLYRVVTITQMAGVLVLAAGAASALDHDDFTLVTVGYVVMRLALVSQWIRVGIDNPTLRNTARRYVGAISVLQGLWVLRLFLPQEVAITGFVVLLAAEICVPFWAQRRGQIPWNPRHIAERYGLFTLILLGESVLASADAVVRTISEGHHIPQLLTIASATLIIAAGMWWIYFAREQHHRLTNLRTTAIFGYFHYVIFAAAGAFSSGIEIAIESIDGKVSETPIAASATLTVPVALFVLGVWLLALRRELSARANLLLLAGAGVVVVATFVPGIGTVIVAALGMVMAAWATEIGRNAPDPNNTEGLFSAG